MSCGCFKRSRQINSNFKHTCVHMSKVKSIRTTCPHRNNQCRNDNLCKRLTLFQINMQIKVSIDKFTIKSTDILTSFKKQYPIGLVLK